MTSALSVFGTQVRAPLLAIALAFAAACGGSTEVAPVVIPPKDVVPATAVGSVTDTLRGVVGANVGGTISVIVKNKAGELIDSALVTFTVVSGGGTTGNLTVRTVGGQASTTWTLGPTAGVQVVTATVGSLTVTFTAVASASTASAISKVAGDAQTAATGTNVATAPSVKVVDRFNNPVPGAQVLFGIASGGGLVIGGTVTTDANGVATVGAWRLGNVGANSITAATGSLSVTFTATATAGAPATITLTPTTIPELTPGQTVQLTARVVDAGGNVIANPGVTWASGNTAIATVSSTGLVTAVGPGNTSIGASVGSTLATAVAVSVTGHPAGNAITSTLTLSSFSVNDLAFTKNQMLVAVSATQQVFSFDINTTTQNGIIPVPTGVSYLVAPVKVLGPAIAGNSSSTSRLSFIDPPNLAVTDGTDITDLLQGLAITSDGARAFALLGDGSLAFYDGAAHTQTNRIQLGGGIIPGSLRISGDTMLYALTTVGVIFQIDIRTATSKQIIASIPVTDYQVGRDGLLYMLDGANSLIRVFDPVTRQVNPRVVVVEAVATTLALSPDNQQIWVTHSNNRITVYTGSLANGFPVTARITTNGAAPIRAYISPTGSFAAITNAGGWVDIVR